MEIHVRENYDRNRYRKTDEPAAEEKGKEPTENIHGSFESQFGSDILGKLNIHRHSVVILFALNALQVEDHLDNGEDDHRNPDGKRIQSSLHAPFHSLINEH